MGIVEKYYQEQEKEINSIPKLSAIDSIQMQVGNHKIDIIRIADRVGWLYEDKQGKKYGAFVIAKEITDIREVVLLLLEQAKDSINKIKK